ncbi:hypothetical protein EDD11_002767 [Mortierella claussenii]|nr:hypothetical protein EDD11_002767 [Mortierella claussenii]
MVSSTSCHSSFPSAKNQPTEPTGCSPSASSTVTKNSTTNAESSDAAGLESSSLNIEQIPVPDASIIQTIETEVPVIDEAKGILSNSSSVPSTVAKEEGGVPERATMTAESLATLSSSSSNKQADSDKKEGKGAYLLHKMGVRKNSFTEGSDFSATDVGHLSARTSLNKGSKRSSKLLNKIVPKFLQTSPMSPTPSNASSAGTGASIGTSGGSPRSQSSGLSPFSTRSSRSASVNSQSPAHKNEADAAVISIALSRSVSLLSKSSQRSLPLVDSEAKPTAEEADQAAFPSTTTPATPLITMSASTPPTFLECLRSGTVGSSNTSLGRRSSCSSVMSKRSDYSSLSRPSGSSMSSLDSAEDDIRGSSSGIKAMQSVYAIQVEYEEADAEVDQADDQEYNRNATATTVEDNCAADDPPLSPYIIDEDCDDDFFLNSVLRKKSQPPTLQLQEKQRNDVGHWYPVMESSYPSNTTLDSMHSTPSLSGWSNSSSRNSTPSPTSPVFMSGQDDEFSTGSSSNSSVTKTGGGHLHYRSNPLPMPIHSGLDEKRCRLREAVSEWRRSANASF